jgi:hypothetical protein
MTPPPTPHFRGTSQPSVQPDVAHTSPALILGPLAGYPSEKPLRRRFVAVGFGREHSCSANARRARSNGARISNAQ